MPDSLLKRLFSFLIVFGFLVVTLGLPLDSWDKVAFLFAALALNFFIPLHMTVRKFLLGVGVTLGILALQSLIPLTFIEEKANVFTPSEPAFKKIPAPIYQYLTKRFQDLYPNTSLGSDGKIYAFSMEYFHQKNTHHSQEGRLKHHIHYSSLGEARFGFMNRLYYNTYYNMKPHRDHLPFFARYDIPLPIAKNLDTKVCWSGDIFMPIGQSYQHQVSETETCFSPAQKGISHFYAVSIDPERPLSLTINQPFSQQGWFWIVRLLSLAGVFLLISIFYPVSTFFQNLKEDQDKRYKVYILISTLAFSFAVAFFYKPAFLTGFLLFPGGDDALSYSSMARLILEALAQGDWKIALMGGEDVFDLMPLHRYTYALNLYLFGETHLGYFLLILFFPLAIFYLIKGVFQSSKIGFILGLIFALIPIFESFGFTQLYIVRLCLRGFAEPFSSLLFFTGITLALPYFKSPQDPLTKDVTRATIIGLCFALAIGARPNVAPGAGLFLLGLTYHLWRTISWRSFLKNLSSLSVGFAPVLLIPLHNFYFGKVLVLFTVAGQKIENLALSIEDYKRLIHDIAHSVFVSESGLKILSHLTKEIPTSRPWLYFVIVINLYGLFIQSLPGHIRLLMLTGLGQLSIVFFYRIAGRYSYLHWSLLLITALYVLIHFYKVYRPASKEL